MAQASPRSPDLARGLLQLARALEFQTLLKERGVATLRRIGTPKSTVAIEEGARTGDRMLRKVIASRRQT
jgi:hypothetical protein